MIAYLLTCWKHIWIGNERLELRRVNHEKTADFDAVVCAVHADDLDIVCGDPWHRKGIFKLRFIHDTEKVFLSYGSFRISLDDKSKSVGLAQRETKVERYDDFVVRFYDDFGESYHIDRLKGYLAFSQKNAPQRKYECEIGRKFWEHSASRNDGQQTMKKLLILVLLSVLFVPMNSSAKADEVLYCQGEAASVLYKDDGVWKSDPS